MKTFNCILGGFGILGAAYCMFFPGATFLSSGLIVAILLGMLGVCSIFEFATNKEKKNDEGRKKLAANGVIELIFGIGAAVLSLCSLFFPAVRAMLDIMILIMFVFWLIYAGIAGIFSAVQQKKLGGKMWVFSLIMNILLIVTGLYGATHLLYAAFAIGYMIGIALLVYGIRLIMSAFEKSE